MMDDGKKGEGRDSGMNPLPCGHSPSEGEKELDGIEILWGMGVIHFVGGCCEEGEGERDKNFPGFHFHI